LKTDGSSSDHSGENDVTNASKEASDHPTSCFCIWGIKPIIWHSNK